MAICKICPDIRMQLDITKLRDELQTIQITQELFLYTHRSIQLRRGWGRFRVVITVTAAHTVRLPRSAILHCGQWLFHCNDIVGFPELLNSDFKQAANHLTWISDPPCSGYHQTFYRTNKLQLADRERDTYTPKPWKGSPCNHGRRSVPLCTHCLQGKYKKCRNSTVSRHHFLRKIPAVEANEISKINLRVSVSGNDRTFISQTYQPQNLQINICRLLQESPDAAAAIKFQIE